VSAPRLSHELSGRATTGFDEEEFAELETLVEERLSKAE
jgi:hypothetical protein